MDELWNYGQYELDKPTLLKHLQSNADSYMLYNNYNDEQKQQFGKALSYISDGINSNNITGNGYGLFTDDRGTLAEDDITRQALKFVHTIANAYGAKNKKKKQEKKEKEIPEQEAFDYNKHGLSHEFNKKYNPFGTDNTYNLWKSGFSTQEDLNNFLLDYIGQYRTNIQNSNYDFSKSQISKDQYLNMLSDLENDIRTDGIQDSDKSKLKFFGLDPSSFLLQQQKEIKPEQKPELEETVPEETKAVSENEDTTKQTESKFGNFPIGDYVRDFKNLGLEESDGWRLAGLAADVLSIIDPEPITAASLGYASDYANYHADELDGINDSWWDDALNVSLSTLGAVPILGDLGMSGKVMKNIGKASKSLGKLLLIPGIFAGVSNSDELKQSVNNIINNDFTVNDLRNTWTVIQLALGATNAVKSKNAKAKAKDISKNAEEALVVELKNNGKTENYQFSGKDKEDLLALKDNPEEFNKYLRENFEGLDNVEAASIKTTKGDLDWKNREHWYSKPKRKEGTKTVVTETKPVYEKGQIPGKWDRARYFLDDTDEAVKPTRKQVTETSKTDKQETKQEVKQETPKTEEVATQDSQANISSEQSKVEAQKQETLKEQSKTTAEEPVKTEEKPDFSKAREAVNEKKSESVKATEIEPDNKSKATEAADTKSEVAKYNASDIRKEFDKLKGKGKKRAKFTLKNAKQDKELADLVKQEPSSASKEFNELLAALQKADKKTTYEQAFKMLTDAGYYKEGGIIKADDGTVLKAPSWYTVRYAGGTSLKDWSPEKRKDYWELTNNPFHGNADTLDTVFKANQAYTKNYNAVGDDIRNYYQNGESLQDFVKRYNDDAAKIRGFWNSKRVYNENTAGSHNTLFKRMFASRSANDGSNADFNLGYQDNIQDYVGSTTWHRRMDQYEKAWKNLTDEEKRSRLHKVDLGDGKFGYVYKEANGDIYDLSNEEAERILNLAEPTGKPVTTPAEPTGNTVSIAGDNSQNPDVEAPVRPNNSFFTPDKALAAFNYFRALRHNKKDLEYAQKITPLLYDPVEHHRSIYGNLRAMAEGRQAAAGLENRASKPLTSDANLQTATQLDAYNYGQQYIQAGLKADDERIRQTSEDALQQEKENKENRYNIAMKNRENMHQVNLEKLQAQVNKTRADYESGTNFINEIRTWLTAKQKEDYNKANLLYSKRLSNYLQRYPNRYISNWEKLHQQAWDNYKAGKILSEADQKIVNQIKDALQEAYYNEMYGSTYQPVGINKPSWEDNYLKLQQGGKITKDMVKAIISFLKESNTNYNKDIDRSVRGLYNHIKLQRKK